MNIPKHIAIIMDGNGRWANLQGKKRIYGHFIGSTIIDKIAKKAKELKIEYLTLYTFSTENWKRPQNEVNFLMKLLGIQVRKKSDFMMKENIKFNCIGDITKLPQKQQEAILNLQEKTKNNSDLTINFAINYGSYMEIIRACKNICMDFSLNKLNCDNIDENIFEQYLYTKDIPDVDLLIRTGGEKRISNFLLWQIAYAEIIFLDKYWPEFNEDDLEYCIKEFSERKRRFGGLDD
ncbi:isoprenyl transferase [Desulfurella multipotens]|jgi:undecaprenyl diphosphate synthase|uniref:Isoprenyl transferase n=1 Tax=Desulfurella multipotens TaxID=79269 RepID=A0A1G6K1P8_9BACT|nr:isoprenyl transferase [Desulfurella multipotens]PMP67598.1 MAG: isoprenyl transferase [Desulfurella multipotens]SDC24877.1 undecaprenyl diphosphate synthase [Desulfurella multipotens]